MDFTTLTIDVLKALSIVGGYGIGIILLTIIVSKIIPIPYPPTIDRDFKISIVIVVKSIISS